MAFSPKTLDIHSSLPWITLRSIIIKCSRHILLSSSLPVRWMCSFSLFTGMGPEVQWAQGIAQGHTLQRLELRPLTMEHCSSRGPRTPEALRGHHGALGEPRKVLASWCPLFFTPEKRSEECYSSGHQARGQLPMNCTTCSKFRGSCEGTERM